MIKSVILGEEIIITTKNKVGLLADVSSVLARRRINIDAVAGYETGKTAKLLLVTSGNLTVVNELKKKYKDVKEMEVVVVIVENKPGVLGAVTDALRREGIDIKHIYVTGSSEGASRMVILTDDNENAMAALSKLTV